MRPYFLISLTQDFSSFSIRAVSFSRIDFPIFVCACTKPTDKMTSIGNNPSLAKDRMVSSKVI